MLSFNPEINKRYKIVDYYFMFNPTQSDDIYGKCRGLFNDPEIIRFISVEDAKKFEINFIEYLFKEKRYSKEEIEQFPIMSIDDYLIIEQDASYKIKEYVYNQVFNKTHNLEDKIK